MAIKEETITVKVSKTIQERQFEPLQVGIECTITFDRETTEEQRMNFADELIEEVKSVLEG